MIAAITQSAGRCAASITRLSPAAASMPVPASASFSSAIGCRIGDGGEAGTEVARDLRQRRRFVGRHRLDAIAAVAALEQIDRAGADRAGRAENA